MTVYLYRRLSTLVTASQSLLKRPLPNTTVSYHIYLLHSRPHLPPTAAPRSSNHPCVCVCCALHDATVYYHLYPLRLHQCPPLPTAALRPASYHSPLPNATV